MKMIHFCGGMPRAGSTVLMNILQQHPNIFTTGTCALSDLIQHHVLVKSRFREQFQAMSVEQADKALHGFVMSGVQGWFGALTNKPIVVSKNRNWSGVFHMFKDSKYIVMIRDLRDIIESVEKLNSKTLALHTVDTQSHSIVYGMSESEKLHYYLKGNNAISGALHTEVPRMMEWFKKDPSRVMFIRYEDLTKDPVYILNKINSFLGLPTELWYTYNLDNIQQSELYEHDNAYFCERTSHTVMPQFQQYKDPKRTLSDSFHNSVMKHMSWYYEAFYPNELK